MCSKIFQTAACALLLTASLTTPIPASTPQADPHAAVDNTKQNKPAQATNEPTADQGKNNTSDRELARQIRRDVVSDKSLSTYGHNVKIIAQHGQVTLKGPVHTEDEKNTIAGYAKKHAGESNVVNDLSVKGDAK